MQEVCVNDVAARYHVFVIGNFYEAETEITHNVSAKHRSHKVEDTTHTTKSRQSELAGTLETHS
jgi:hypothetical protein